MPLPGGVGSTKLCRGARVGAEAQQHECRQSPLRPVLRLVCGPTCAPQPTHRGSRESSTFIPRTRDYRNRNLAGDPAPPFPLVELREIVRSHQPDEALFGESAAEFGDSIDGVARAELVLDRADADRRVARHPHGGGKACGEGGHVTALFLERIAGRDEPPHFVEPQRIEGCKADRAVAGMRWIERAAEDADAGQVRIQFSRA